MKHEDLFIGTAKKLNKWCEFIKNSKKKLKKCCWFSERRFIGI